MGAIKQQTATSLPSAHFDTATYDPIRSEDMWNMVGAWKLGRVMDTKAAVHERYAGGPRDTAALVSSTLPTWYAPTQFQRSSERMGS